MVEVQPTTTLTREPLVEPVTSVQAFSKRWIVDGASDVFQVAYRGGLQRDHAAARDLIGPAIAYGPG